jgi:hypothetical protein
MLVISRLLSKESISDEKWIKEAIFIVIGFSVYDIFTYKFKPKNINYKYKPAVYNVMYYGTMFIVSRLLDGKSFSDEKWIKSSLYTIVGFIVFDLIVQKLFAKFLINVCEDEIKAQNKSQAEMEAQAEIESQAKAEIESQAKAEIESQVKAEIESQAKAEIESQVKAEIESQAKAEIESQADIEAQAQAEIDAQIKGQMVRQAQIKGQMVRQAQNKGQMVRQAQNNKKIEGFGETLNDSFNSYASFSY